MWWCRWGCGSFEWPGGILVGMDDKISRLEKRIAENRERTRADREALKKLKAQERARTQAMARRVDTRRKVLVGVAVLGALRGGGLKGADRRMLLRLIRGSTFQPRDRSVIDDLLKELGGDDGETGGAESAQVRESGSPSPVVSGSAPTGEGGGGGESASPSVPGAA